MMEMEKSPITIIKAPTNYEQTHELMECPLCNNPNPVLDMYMPVREFGYFDINLYVCNTRCEYHFGTGYDITAGRMIVKSHKHKFSVKHEILTDAQHLKIYDRTHVEDVW
jgi:hypothetical protein